MTRIIIGTTPTITYTFKVVPVDSIVTAVLTIKERGENIIEKDLSDATVGEDTLSWTLTQEETLSLNSAAEHQSKSEGKGKLDHQRKTCQQEYVLYTLRKRIPFRGEQFFIVLKSAKSLIKRELPVENTVVSRNDNRCHQNSEKENQCRQKKHDNAYCVRGFSFHECLPSAKRSGLSC